MFVSLQRQNKKPTKKERNVMKTKTVYLIEVHFKVSIDGKYEEKR